jgi:hypothetical protein
MGTTKRVASALAAAGVLNTTTNANGEANVTFDLSSIPSLKPSQSITVTAEWVGPTRERITKAASILCALLQASSDALRIL